MARGRSAHVARLTGLVLVTLASWASAAPEDPGEDGSVTSYAGIAKALGSGDFLYGEQHVLQVVRGKLTDRVVLYTCRDGSAFARKTVSYVDDLAPDFALEDAATGMAQGIRASGSAREVYFRRDRSAVEIVAALANSPGLVADSGFDAFVRANWQRLMSGRALPMRFLVPSRVSAMNFNVEHLRSERVDGVDAEVFRLQLSGVLGLLVPHIDVFYDASEHLLIRYVGVSDLRDRSNDNYSADIAFPSSERHDSSLGAMHRARHAPLAACR